MQETPKPNPLKTILTIAISLLFAALFMWLAIKDLNFVKMKESLLKANYFWVLAAMVFGLLAYWFRAVRWNILLEPMDYQISNQNSLWSISFGYLMNLTIPRSGELARATALYGVEKVPVDKSFGTIILERVVDLVCMLAFLGLTLIFKYDAIIAFYRNSGIKINPIFVFVGILALIFSVFIFSKFKGRFEKFPFLDKVLKFIEGIFNGLLTIFRLKQKGKFILLSLAIWVSYYFAAYLVCFALPETKDFTVADGFFIIVVGTLGMMVPASGGIGAFNLAMKFGFAALFLSMGKSAAEGGEIGIVYSFISLPLQIFIMLVMGIISIFMLAKSRNNLLKKEAGK